MIGKQSLKTPKDHEQYGTLAEWAKNNFHGTYEGTTGCGKTRIGVEAVGITLSKKIQAIGITSSDRALIITVRENLRDNEWKNEIIKWGYEHLIDRIEIKCIQSAYKKEDEYYTVLILDEVHEILSEEYIKILLNNRFERILGLSATIDKDKKEILKSFGIPVFRTLSLDKALEKKIISNFKLLSLPVVLTEEEDKSYNETVNQIKTGLNLFNDNFNTALACMKDWKYAMGIAKSEGLTVKDVKDKAVEILKLTNKKCEILYEAIEKVDKSIEIVLEYPNFKTIIFTERIDTAKLIHERLIKYDHLNLFLFHSKLKKGKIKDQVLKDFKDCKSGILVTCKTLNVGFNVPECDLGIIVAGKGTKTDMLQRLGRLLRLTDDPNKVAMLIQLYCKNTEDEKWVNTRCATIPFDNKYLLSAINYIKQIDNLMPCK